MRPLTASGWLAIRRGVDESLLVGIADVRRLFEPVDELAPFEVTAASSSCMHIDDDDDDDDTGCEVPDWTAPPRPSGRERSHTSARVLGLVRWAHQFVAVRTIDLLAAQAKTGRMSLQSKTFLGVATILLSMSLGATACDDPAEGKAKAKVEDADPKAEAEKTDAKADGKSDGETAAAAAAAALSVDTEASKVQWVGSKVSGSHPGGFKKFSAKLSAKDGKAAGGSVSAEIDTTSLYSDSDKLTEHLMSADFFEVDAHPTAKFDSTSIAEGGSEGFNHTVEGTLTLHGTTKKITFPANIDMADNGAKVTSEFSINRKDFGMEYAGMADDLIRDDVVIKLDLVFPKA